MKNVDLRINEKEKKGQMYKRGKMGGSEGENRDK